MAGLFQCDYKSPLSRWFDMVRHLKEAHDVMVTRQELCCHLCGKLMDDDEQLFL